MLLDLSILLVGIVLGVSAQLFLKSGVEKSEIQYLHGVSFFEKGKRMFLNWYVFFGFGAYAVSLLLWHVVLSHLELSYAYPMVSSGYLFVALFSRLLFHEKVSWQRWLSIFLIIFGVVLVGLS